MTRRTSAMASTAAGVAIALACAWFVGNRLHHDWTEVREALRHASLPWVVLALALAGAGMTAIALGWRAVLAALGHRHRSGRGELARRGGVRRPAAYASVALSLGLLYLAAATVACVLLPFVLEGADARVAVVLVLPPIGLVCVAGMRGMDAARRADREETWVSLTN